MSGPNGYTKIGSYTKRALILYLLTRQAPEKGDYLEAVLHNNLKEAMFKADETNLASIKALVMWLHWYANSDAFGSPEKVKAWLKSTLPVQTVGDMDDGIALLGPIPEFQLHEVSSVLQEAGFTKYTIQEGN